MTYGRRVRQINYRIVSSNQDSSACPLGWQRHIIVVIINPKCISNLGNIYSFYFGFLETDNIRSKDVDYLFDVSLLCPIVETSDIPTEHFVLMNDTIHGIRGGN
jgi:hypothetical protein